MTKEAEAAIEMQRFKLRTWRALGPPVFRGFLTYRYPDLVGGGESCIEVEMAHREIEQAILEGKMAPVAANKLGCYSDRPQWVATSLWAFNVLDADYCPFEDYPG